MIAKQYTLPLPADYDMGIIRHRVATRGAAFDDFPGLLLKAFLIREKGKHGGLGHAYAPFYVWRDTDGLWDFVAGPGFRGIVDDFGRPSIRHWIAMDVAMRTGVDRTRVRAARLEESGIDVGTDLADLRRDETVANRAALDDPSVVARVVAIDPDAWRLVRFTLWACMQDALPDAEGSFEVLHLSAPGL